MPQNHEPSPASDSNSLLDTQSLRDRNEGRRHVLALLKEKKFDEALIVSQTFYDRGMATPEDHQFVLYIVRVARTRRLEKAQNHTVGGANAS